MSHENTGNQFGHASAIFTFILLAVTAVCQIICLNKGLAAYDSTLVVPVFYGVYTGLGCVHFRLSPDVRADSMLSRFLDSLVGRHEIIANWRVD